MNQDFLAPLSRILDIERSRPVSCCNNPENLTLWQLKEDFYMELCQFCKRRHFVAYADPGNYDSSGSKL